MSRRLNITCSKDPVMTVMRRAVKSRRLVYLICTPKPQSYANGNSRVVYIGTTGVGVRRVASSMAHKSIDFLSHWGVRWLEVYTVTCPPRPGIQSWRRLERDLLITFNLVHGRVPLGNTSGKNLTPDRLSGLFQYRRLLKVLKAYS